LGRRRARAAPLELADLHTHLIPGVDDGAPDLESALQALQTCFNDGVRAVAATPHLNASNLSGNRRALADEAWPALARAARDRFPGITLYRGYEIQLDTPQLDLGDPGLRLAGSRYALVEFYAFTVPERSAEVLARVAAGRYVPIIVHPERYWGYDRGYGIVADWRAAGALLQLNSGSLLGEYGENVRLVAHRFLAEGQVDLIASDNHARPERSPSLRAAWDYLVARGLEEQARLLLATNPQRILQDEPTLNVGRVERTDGFLARLSRRLRGGRRS
jgi:protein-tyrosine phosphatase